MTMCAESWLRHARWANYYGDSDFAQQVVTMQTCVNVSIRLGWSTRHVGKGSRGAPNNG